MMTTLSFTDEKVLSDESGLWLCLKVTDAAAARRFCLGQTEKNALMDAELKEHRVKRSGEANRYLWHLLGDLSDALQTAKEELYLLYVKKYGLSKDWILTEDEAKTFSHVWSKQGLGWPTEIVDYAEDGDRRLVRAYYGTSCYNTKQMSRILDQVVEGCKALGIETLPPEKLEAMKQEWKREI